MDNFVENLNRITEKIIGSAIEVHRNLGPGLLESIYENALCYELKSDGMHCAQQVRVPIMYKEQCLGECRLDLIVENEIIVELKAVDRVDFLFEAQLMTYLKVTGKKIGLLINFNVPVLKNGIRRIIL
jgi:GxxExxY protein